MLASLAADVSEPTDSSDVDSDDDSDDSSADDSSSGDESDGGDAGTAGADPAQVAVDVNSDAPATIRAGSAADGGPAEDATPALAAVPAPAAVLAPLSSPSALVASLQHQGGASGSDVDVPTSSARAGHHPGIVVLDDE